MSSVEHVEAKHSPAQDSFADLGSIYFGLASRVAHSLRAVPETGGPLLACILKHVYLGDPMDPAKLAAVDRPGSEWNLFISIVQNAFTLLHAVDIARDSKLSQQQVLQHVSHVLLQQADLGTCGIPTSVLACCLVDLLETTQRYDSALDGRLVQQADLLTPAFKRVAAGKCFTHCLLHEGHECSQSAKQHLIMAFASLAKHSYHARVRLWDNGLLPFLIQNLRGTAPLCRTSAVLTLSWTLGSQITSNQIMSAYTCQTPRPASSNGSTQAEMFVDRGFAAVTQMLQDKLQGLSVGDVKAILQLASTALIWHQKSDVFLSNHFPWQLCLRLLAEVLQLPIRSDSDWGGSTAQVQFATDASLADATPEAVSLMASLTTSCIHAVKFVRGTDTDFAGLEDCCNWLLALLESCLETHVIKPWSGVIVMLLAAFNCHLNQDIEVKLASGSDFNTSVEAGLRSSIMTELLGSAAAFQTQSSITIGGMVYASLCNGTGLSRQQLQEVDTLLVAWHLTQVWTADSAGYSTKKHAVQLWLKEQTKAWGWPEHLQRKWGLPSEEPVLSESDSGGELAIMPPKTSVNSTSTEEKKDEMSRVSLEPTLESLADQQDAEGFKQHLPAAVQLFQQQFEVADSCFIKNAHQMAHAGRLQHDSVDKQQYLANIWEVNGFKTIIDAVMTVLDQANKRGIAVSEGTPLADLDSLQSRLVQHKDLLAAFAYAAEDTVHTWTIDSLTHSKLVLAEKAKQLKANPAAVTNAAKRAAQQVLAEASKQGTQASSSVAMQSDLAPYKQLLVDRPAFSEEHKPLPQTPPQECNDTQARCSAELLAAGDLHKENDDRFNAITQALGDAAHQPVSTEDSSTQGATDQAWHRCVPLYSHLMHQLKYLPISRKIEIARLVGSGDDNMTVLKSFGQTLEQVHEISALRQQGLQQERLSQMNSVMERLALICSFASLQCQPDAVLDMPDRVRAAAQQFVNLSLKDRGLLSKLASHVEEYLAQKVVRKPSMSVSNSDALNELSADGSDSDDSQMSAGPADRSPVTSPAALDKQVIQTPAAASATKTAKSPAAVDAAVSSTQDSGQRQPNQAAPQYKAESGASQQPPTSLQPGPVASAEGAAVTQQTPKTAPVAQESAALSRKSTASRVVGSSNQDADLPAPTGNTSQAAASGSTAQATADTRAAHAAEPRSDATPNQSVGQSSDAAVGSAASTGTQSTNQEVASSSQPRIGAKASTVMPSPATAPTPAQGVKAGSLAGPSPQSDSEAKTALPAKLTQQASTVADGIAAHRPAPAKTILRAAATPYTPVNPAAAAAKAKTVAQNLAGAKPSAMAAARDQAKPAVPGRALTARAVPQPNSGARGPPATPQPKAPQPPDEVSQAHDKGKGILMGHGGVTGALQPGHLAKQAALDRARGPIGPSNPPPTLSAARGKQPSAARQPDAVHAERPVSKAAPAMPARPISKAAPAAAESPVSKAVPAVPERPVGRAVPGGPEHKADNSSVRAQTQPAKLDSPRSVASSARGSQSSGAPPASPASSDGNLSQHGKTARQRRTEARQQDQAETSAAAVSAAGARLLEEPQQKLTKKQRRAQRKEQTTAVADTSESAASAPAATLPQAEADVEPGTAKASLPPVDTARPAAAAGVASPSADSAAQAPAVRATIAAPDNQSDPEVATVSKPASDQNQLLEQPAPQAKPIVKGLPRPRWGGVVRPPGGWGGAARKQKQRAAAAPDALEDTSQVAAPSPSSEAVATSSATDIPSGIAVEPPADGVSADSNPSASVADASAPESTAVGTTAQAEPLSAVRSLLPTGQLSVDTHISQLASPASLRSQLSHAESSAMGAAAVAHAAVEAPGTFDPLSDTFLEELLRGNFQPSRSNSCDQNVHVDTPFEAAAHQPQIAEPISRSASGPLPRTAAGYASSENDASSTGEPAAAVAQAVEIAEEQARAAAAKPKPKSSRGRTVQKASEASTSSVERVRQQLMMEKPKPRRRPRATVQASYAAAVNETTAMSDSTALSDNEIMFKLEEDFTCPITQEFFKDPVTAADGYNYEHYAITDWLSKHDTSPMTNLPLSHRKLTSNASLKAAMQDLLKQLSPAGQLEAASYMS